jgi:hypothetical protein
MDSLEFAEFFSSWEEATGRTPLSVPANVFCSSILGEAEDKARRRDLSPKGESYERLERALDSSKNPWEQRRELWPLANRKMSFISVTRKKRD